MKKRRAFTLVETLTAAGVISLASIGMVSLLATSARSLGNTADQYEADTSASLAMQLVNRDLQEAKQVQVLSPTAIRVFYPKLEADGTYNRTVLDTVNTIDFFRGNKDGTANSTGGYVVRKPATGGTRTICKNVDFLQFVSISPSSVDISLRTLKKQGGWTRRCDMIHRAIFLRNY